MEGISSAVGEPDVRPFDRYASAWDDYTRTPLGRLRTKIPLHQLRDYLPDTLAGLRVLDAGCGNGGVGLALAREGAEVVFSDVSPAMLDLARQWASALGLPSCSQITFHCASVDDLLVDFGAGAFDVVICHTLLEFLGRPLVSLATLVKLLRPDGVISVVFTNPQGEVLRAALGKQDLHAARQALEGQVAAADLFGLPRRPLGVDDVSATLEAAGATVVGRYGVRLFADCLPPDKLRDPAFWDRLFDLEIAAGPQEPYRHLARYTHLVGRVAADS